MRETADGRAYDGAHAALSDDVSVDLGGISRRLWAKKWLLLAVPLLATLVAFLVLQVVEPRYRAQADLYFKGGDDVLSSGAGETAQATARALDEQGIASQVEMLKSRRIARAVIERFDLLARPEFNPDESASPFGGLKELLGRKRRERRSSDAEQVLETYFDKLKVYQANRARVVSVQFSSTDPKLAADIPNAVTREYLAMQRSLKRGAGPEELESLRKELAAIKARLEEAEAAVGTAREQGDVYDGQNSNLATQELSELVTELSRQRSRRAQLEARAEAISRALASGSLSSAPGISDAPLIQRLRERQANLNSQIAELSTTLLPGHPRIRSLRSQVGNLRRQIRLEARTILRGLQQDAAIAAERERALVRERDAAKAEATRMRGETVKVAALEREAQAQRQLYNTYLLRFNEAESRLNREFVSSDAVVFSDARTPAEPYFPKPVPILGGTFFGTFLLMVVGIVAVGLGRAASTPLPAPAPARRADARPSADRAVAPEAREDEPAEPVALPLAPAAPPLVPDLGSLDPTPVEPAPRDPENGVIPTARTLALFGRARLVFLTPGDVGGEGGEGGAQATLALGRELVENGSAAIVVDLSGSAGVSQVTRLRRTRGLGDLIAGTADFGAAVHAAPGGKLHVMPVGLTPIEDAAALRDALPELLNALEAAYDFVLVDCGRADLHAIRQVSNEMTVLVVNAPDGETRAVREAVRMAKRRGHDEPLILTPESENA